MKAIPQTGHGRAPARPWPPGLARLLGAVLAALLGWLALPTSVRAQLPVTSGLYRHYKADAGVSTDGSGNVMTWADQSPNAAGAIQSGSAQRPALVATGLGGQPTLRFDGVDDVLTLSSNVDLTSGGLSIFIVGRVATRKNYNGMLRIAPALTGNTSDLELYWQQGSAGSGNMVYIGNRAASGNGYKELVTNDAGPTAPAPFIYGVSATSGASRGHALNGTTSGTPGGTGSFLPANSNAAWIGVGYGLPFNGGGTQYLNGDISEVILYNREVTAAEQTQIETYLSNKYLIATTANPSPSNGSAIAYYPFTGNTNDASPNGYNATNSGATLTTDRSGTANAAYAFNGTGAQMSLPNNAALKRYAHSFTVTAWVRPVSSANAVHTIISNRTNVSSNNGGSRFGVVDNGTTTPLLFDVKGGATGESLIGTTNLPLNAWTHVAITFRYNGSNANVAKLYVNGSLDASTTTMDDILDPGTQVNIIGGENTPVAGISRFAGSLDEVKVFDRELTAAEITAMQTVPVTSGLRLYLAADQLTGVSNGASVTTWTDLSGQNNHATAASGTAPTYQTSGLNGLPVVRFTAGNLATPAVNLTGTSQIDFFAVAKSRTMSAAGLIEASTNYNSSPTGWTVGDNDNSCPNCQGGLNASIHGDVGYNQASTTLNLRNYGLVESQLDKSLTTLEAKLRVNGMDVSRATATTDANNTNAFGNDAWYIGGRSPSPTSQEDIAEMLVYDHLLTPAERTQVETYLSNKYNLGLSGPAFTARAVRVLSARYWFDGGAKTTMSAADGAFDQALETAVASAAGSLGTGIHSLNIEMQGDDGQWGPVSTSTLSVLAPFTARTVRIQSGEVQLGANAPVAVAAVDGAFNTAVEAVVKSSLATGVATGPQALIIRLRGEDGQFGPNFTSVLTVVAPQAARPVQITSGEVQLGANPAVAVVAVDGAFNTAVEEVVKSGLASGAVSGPQILRIRLMGADGQFGPWFNSSINVLAPMAARPVRIVSGEVQLGANPAVLVVATDGSFDEAVEDVVKSALSAGATTGPQTLKLRLMGEDGQFGPYFTTAINVIAPMTARLVRIQEGRVWWDSDLAGAVAMTIVNGNLNPALATALGVRPTGALDAGVHALKVQLKGDDGQWGNTFSRVVNITPCTAPAKPVASATSTVVYVGQTINLQASTVSGATYEWRGPNGFSTSSQNPSITNAQLAAGGTYWVAAVGPGPDFCHSAEDSVNVTVLPQVVIATGAVAPTSLCAGTSFNVTYDVTSGSVNAGNQFRVQLSDNSGSFTVPTQIGALNSTALNGSVPVTIPSGILTGTQYRIRVVSTSPAINGANNGAALTITQPFTATATSNSPVFAGSNIILGVTGVPGGATYAWTGPNSFVSAAAAPNISNAQAVNAGTYQVTVTVGGCQSTSSVTVAVNQPGTVAITSITPTTFCAGTGITISFTTAGVFSAGNVFTAQLSATNGSFASPVTLGTLSGTSGGTINGTIPANTPAGTGYRVRIVASSPAHTSADNGTNLTIGAPFSLSAAATQFVAVGGTISLSVTGAPGGATYAWTGPGGFVSSADAPTRSGATAAMTGTYSVTVTSGSCQSTANIYVRVFDCATANLAAGLPAGQYFASSTWSGSAQSAFNGGAWNAGGFTGYVGVDFGQSVSFNGLTLTAGMSPNGNVNHVIETSNDLSNWSTASTITGTVSNGQVLFRSFAPVTARALRIRTTSTPSWVSWANIQVTGCAPYITSFTPTAGPGGTSVAITGGNLTGATGVAFNGTSAPGFVVNSATSISVNAPLAGSTGPITVTTPVATAVSTTDYTYQLGVVVSTISPTTYCAGGAVSVPFSVTGGTFNAGNVFTAQLVDSLGTARGTIGTLTGTTSGTINGTMPAVGYSLHYRIRIVSSLPTQTSPVNGQDLTIINLSGATATSNAPVATGSALNFDVTGLAAASLNTYAWSKISGGGTFSSALRNPTIPTTTTANSGTYQVIISRGGCSVTRTVSVTVFDPTSIATGTIAPTTLCTGDNFAIPYTATGTFNGGNVFSAFLVDSVGVERLVGQTAATTSGTITGFLSGVAPRGTHYRVVVKSSNPAVTGTPNGADLTVVNFSTFGGTSNSPVATGGTIQFGVTNAPSGVTFSWTGPNGFATTGAAPQITGATTANDGLYTVSFVKYGCTTSRTFSVTVNPPVVTASITTTGPASGTYCAGSPIYVDFTTSGTFNSGNVFTAQLSDAAGSFASPTTIGTVAGTGQGAGQIGGALPAGLPTGNGYLVRVISSNPAVTGTASGPLTVGGTSFTWVGGTDSNWNNPANWSCGVVPGASDDVTINPGNHAPVIGAGNAVVRSITINANVTLTVNTTITVYGHVVNNGTIGAGSGSGWVWAGTGGTWTVGGNGTFNFWHVTVNNTVNVTINTDVTIRGNVGNGGVIYQPWNYYCYLPGTSTFSGNPTMSWGTYYVQGGSVTWGTGISAWSIYNGGGTINTGTSPFTFVSGGSTAGTIGGTSTVPFYDVVFSNPNGVNQQADIALYHFWTNNYVFNPGTRRITFTGPGTLITGPTTFYDIVIDINADVTLNVDIRIDGDLINNGQFHHGGHHVIFGGTGQIIGGTVITNFWDVTFNNTVNLTLNQHIVVDGNWLNQGHFEGNGWYTLFSGTGAQTVGGLGTTHFGTVRWNNPAGVTLAQAIGVGGDFAYLGGIWSAGGYPVTFDGTTTQTILGPNTPHFAGLVNNNSSVAGLTLGTGIRVGGNASGTGHFCGCGFETWFDGTMAQVISGPGRWDFHHVRITSTVSLTLNVDIHVTGNWYLDGIFLPGTFTVYFDGLALQLIHGPVITNFYHLLINNVVNVTLNQTIRVRGNFSGPGQFTGDGWFTIFDGPGAQTISVCGCTRFGHLTFNNANGVTLLTGIGLTGNFLNTGGFAHGGQTVGFYGAGTQTINGAGGSIGFHSAYVASGATASLGLPATFVGNLTNDGTWQANTHANTFTGGTAVIGGTNAPLFYHLYLDGMVTLAVNLNIRGDIRINGTLVPVTYACIFAGTAPQQIYGTAVIFNFYHITVNTLAVVNVQVDIHIRGNLVNNGTINWPTCRVVTFDGTTPQNIGGTTVTRFCHLTCNNASGVGLGQHIRCTGDFRDLGGWNAGAWTTTFDGSGAQGIYGLIGGGGNGTTFGGMTFANGAGVTLFGPVRLTGDFRNTAGFANGGYPVTFGGTGTQQVFGPSPITFHHFIIDVAATVRLNLDIRLTGNWTNNNVFLPNGWTVWFIGTVAQFVNGPAVTNFHHLTINNTVSVSLNHDIRIRGNFLDNGVFCGCGHLTTFDGTALQTITCNSGNTRFHDLTFANNAGVRLISAIGVTGNWVNNGGFQANGQLVLFAGTGAQTIGGSALTTFHHWQNTNNSTAGVSLIRDAAWTGNWTNDGRYCGCGFGSSFVGTTPQTITCHTLQSAFHHITLANTSAGGVTLGGHIGVTGNWHVTGNFFPATWTVYFQGTAGQTITRGGSMLHCQFYGLWINNLSTAGVSLGANCPLYIGGNFSCNGPFNVGQNGVWANGGTGGNGAGGNGAGSHFGGSGLPVGQGGGTGGAQDFSGEVPCTFWNWTIQNPNGVTCSGPVRIIRVLTMANGGGNLHCGGNLLLVSTPQNTAMVVNEDGGGECDGLATMERAITSGSTAKGYRHYSSPMKLSAPATINSFADDLKNFSINPQYNTIGDKARPFPNLYQYDEARLNATDNSFTRGYLVPPSTSTLLEPGRGYSAMTEPTTVVDITGYLQNGPVTAPTLTRGTFGESGWSLVGNPYPAPIDWRNVTVPQGLDNAVYVHKPSGTNTGSYASWVNGVAQNGGSPVLASMQGFFVRMNQQGSTQLNFTNAARLTTYDSPTYWRQAADQRPQVRVSLRSQATGADDETVLYFENGTTGGFDRGFDAAKATLAPGATDPVLWSETGKQSFAINGRPVADLTSGVVIPLGLRVPQDGDYVLTAPRLLNLPAGTPVWLEDRLLGKVQNLTLDSLYHFQMKAGATAPRFFLNVGRVPVPTTASTPDLSAVKLDVYPNPALADLTVRLEELPNDLHAVKATLTNVLGETAVTTVIEATSGTAATRLDVSHLSQGVYTLRLTVPGPAGTSWTQKVVIGR